ncbi:hypothetical protein TVAG_393040 [Trichomonas vaginalis G3]|uniref:receptor protein-tyrosine kinase n=1 Tax=Trichomonas vaginalis (strain ATCC PRA-98 / G3) TaxID=412133 RepID=A2DYA0_TRIV3|nr:glycine-rich protein family [Trichomonas vaginalis G3]EAY14577.1 hypothetical protein TVAG_393040 [Trichomonas vaginalis G3]KAI5526587.1 glycine-rich protein family [Trichomonas vaginalis G3]|eukprot:XP_001326800.1 hypothetical protein [Trichomonas vaginalis G3]
MLKYKLVNASKVGARINVIEHNHQYIFNYPCTSSTDCTDYEITFPPGVYKFELYGSSGGTTSDHVSSYRFPNGSCISNEIVNLYRGNTQCLTKPNIGGAGGYISGIIRLRQSTKSYATIGGQGRVATPKSGCENKPSCFERSLYSPGGYGGGGSAPPHSSVGTGGGQTAVKFRENTLWHRVIVAGSGGGCDNIVGEFMKADDGSGGSGGGLTAQGWFENGKYIGSYLANSTFGFTFGSGEAPQLSGSMNINGVHKYSQSADKPGSGSGWFGGFASHDPDSGSGGGSSWALTKDAIIPKGNINATDDFYTLIGSREYEFSKADYLFSNVIHQAGIWEGNGRLIIRILEYEPCPTYKCFLSRSFLFTIIVSSISE